MSVNETFVSRKSGVECPMCATPDGRTDAASDAPSDLVIELPSGLVRLQNDANYRGYCILILNHHKTEIHELSESGRRNWIEDIARIERAVTAICNPDKINIAMLGNLVPHLHCHVIPRYFDDTEWGAPPQFRTPSERTKLEESAYSELLLKLREHIKSEPDFAHGGGR